MSVSTQAATLADLARIGGKAELIGGRIVEFLPTGLLPNEVAGLIFISLRLYLRSSDKTL